MAESIGVDLGYASARMAFTVLIGDREYPVEWPDAASNGEMMSAPINANELINPSYAPIRVRAVATLDG